ncbi:N-acetylneuraminate synthase family protein [Fluviispira vulneris]|uniref:N-acetylneuraminate synthase family protein n=1 Tax=Fluviispira vulneris TaxID=2763012 RepID=UPI001646C5C4|nr:N-acetylneuraminate synthase family protein [Fluviispira vulneris]
MFSKEIKIGKYKISYHNPTLIIAEIGSNFDGSIDRAKKLIYDAYKCGAQVAKFQSFKAEKIISEKNFKNTSFQSNWKKSVGEVYKSAELPLEWIIELKAYSEELGLEFMSAPYDIEALEQLVKNNITSIKIGSGEISNVDFLKTAAETNLPILLATGASSFSEIDEAMHILNKYGSGDVILLQCVTQYPTDFSFSNIRVIEAYSKMYECITGYSDHTPGLTVPLGAVALGARVIEKHFTDDKSREGPDHAFAMNLVEFTEMSKQIRNLELALGKPWKKIEECEEETKILQRRGLVTKGKLQKGERITLENSVLLRPQKGILPKDFHKVIGKHINKDMEDSTPICWEDIQ